MTDNVGRARSRTSAASSLIQDSDADDHGVFWSHSDGLYWLVYQDDDDYWRAFAEGRSMPMPCGPIDVWRKLFQEVPNSSPLPSHPCAVCDAAIFVNDYLCETCR